MKFSCALNVGCQTAQIVISLEKNQKFNFISFQTRKVWSTTPCYFSFLKLKPHAVKDIFVGNIYANKNLLLFYTTPLSIQLVINLILSPEVFAHLSWTDTFSRQALIDSLAAYSASIGAYPGSGSDWVFHEHACKLINDLLLVVPEPCIGTPSTTFVDRQLENINNNLVIIKDFNLITPSDIIVFYEKAKSLIMSAEHHKPCLFFDPITPAFKDIMRVFDTSIALALIRKKYSQILSSVLSEPVALTVSYVL